MQGNIIDTMFISTTEQGTPLEQLEAAYGQLSVLRFEKQQCDIKIASLEEENARLKEQLQLAQQRHFGKKRDASNAGEPVADDAPPQNETEQATTVASYLRKKKRKSCGHLADLSSLPRHQILHDLSEVDKICSGCNNPLHLIEQEKTEQLEILPQRFYVAEHIRYKYGCRTCSTILMAPKEPSPLPKALAGSSLLAEIVINKYQYHLPLYRQSKIMASLGMKIPDNTLGNWNMGIGSGLMPIYDAFWKVMLAVRYLQVDETPVKILNPEKKGYLWTYFAPHIGHGLVVFELSLTRSGTVAETRLAPFKGILQTDGYGGYHGLRHRKDIEGLGCITHARRKFSEVVKITKNQDGIAAQALKKLKPLYELEAMIRKNKYSFRTRKCLRQKIAWPILKDFNSWLRKILPSVPPRSQLANAIQYTLNQWPYLIKYLRHGMAEIDTNWVEGEIRDIAIGRRNWLFMGNEDSGKVHALFYTLVSSAILNGLNPRLYIHYLITKVHGVRRGEVDAMTLLPHTIDRELLRQFSDDLLADAKTILNSG